MTAGKKTIIILATFCLIALLGITLPHVSFAADTEGGFVIIPEECLGAQTNAECDLNSFVQLFVNLAQVAFKILPYLAMLMMMWAGFNLISAGGNPEKIQQGKKMIISVVVGVIIVIFLAWAYTGFIVFALTGDVTIFPDTKPFTRDWWGGGEATAHPPNSGCCVVQYSGCSEVTQTECTSWSTKYGDDVQFMGESVFCSEAKAVCENYTKGCCVPINNSDKTCYWPDATTGCISWPTTEHDPTACTYLGQDCDPDKIQGSGSADESVTGCCVQASVCSMTKVGDCQAGSTFLQGQDCSTSTEAKALCGYGCCIGKNSCAKGKVGCDSKLWNQQECDQLTAECETGCCQQDPSGNNNCYNDTTAQYCGSVLQGNPNGGVNCSSVPSCTDGCCTETCQDGNIDGSCANLTYDPDTACSANTSCSQICCLYLNALTCSENVLSQTCSQPPNTRYTSLPGGLCGGYAQCDTGTCRNTTTGACVSPVARDACTGAFTASPAQDPLCATGCCANPNNDQACHDSYTLSQCTAAGGTFTAGACSAVANCSGCCIQATNEYNCYESWTSYKCSATFPTNDFQASRCYDVVDSSTAKKACVTGCCRKTTVVSPTPYVERNDCYTSTELYCSTNTGTFLENDNSCANTDTASGCDNIINKLP